MGYDGPVERFSPPAVTEAIEDYLKAAYKLSSHGGRATVVRLAASLEVSAPSVTNMVKKLHRMGLVDHAPYAGVTLTARGTRIALEIIRHHRLWELYLTKRLGLPLHRVHAEAERLEHVLSDAMEERLEALLGDPVHDPHGDPIPSRDGRVRPVPHGRRLSELRPGETGTVTHVSDREAGHVKTIAALGLLPGVRLAMDRRGAAGGGFAVRVGARRRTVSRTVADLVRVI